MMDLIKRARARALAYRGIGCRVEGGGEIRRVEGGGEIRRLAAPVDSSDAHPG